MTGHGITYSLPSDDGPTSFLVGIPRLDGRAMCAEVDPELFYPEVGGNATEAKQLCAQCPVIAQCRQFAFDNDERWGIWGGLSENERQKMRREMRRNKGVAPVPPPVPETPTTKGELRLARERRREAERLRWLAEGMPDNEIARRHGISVQSVRNWRRDRGLAGNRAYDERHTA